MSDRTPRVVSREMIDRASRVVTFGCLDRCPAGIGGKGEDWPLPGATGKTFDELRDIRDQLSKRVDGLISRFCLAK